MKKIAVLLLAVILMVLGGCSNNVTKEKINTEKKAEKEAADKNKDPQLLAYVVNGKVKTVEAKTVLLDTGVTIKMANEFEVAPIKGSEMDLMLGDGASSI
jgi:PBP1b-binding outer membrane lipoprotein LpoB